MPSYCVPPGFSDPHTVRALLELLEGRSITRIRRLFYVFRGGIEQRFGSLELQFADGDVVWFDSGPDGESLEIITAEWVDPFAPPLSPENEEYVRRHGKLTAFDVSTSAPYIAIVGHTITRVDTIDLESGKIVGLVLVVADHHLRAEVAGDELYVEVLAEQDPNQVAQPRYQ